MSGADFSENMSWQNNVFAFMLDVQTSFFSLRYSKYMCVICAVLHWLIVRGAVSAGTSTCVQFQECNILKQADFLIQQLKHSSLA